MAKILICDDHPFTLMGTKAYVEGLGHRVCEICNNGINALNGIRQHKPDIALLDINTPGMNGLEVLEQVSKGTAAKASGPLSTKVILLTMHREISIFRRARELNAKGYVLKEFSTDVLDTCLQAVLRGETWFSPELDQSLFIDNLDTKDNGLNKLTFAEKKIAKLIAEQYKTKEIAQLLFISEKTVDNHRHNMMRKLDLPAQNNALLVWAVANKNHF